MANLLSLRQRIRAVETTRKITHAMRLIAMSLHARLRHKKTDLTFYKKTFQHVWSRIQETLPTSDQANYSEKTLVIIVASQKGLCGTFNAHLFKYIQQAMPFQLLKSDSSYEAIAIGKHAVDFLKAEFIQPIGTYPLFNSTIFVSIAQAITTFLLSSQPRYKQVVVYSNTAKSFFSQQPTTTYLWPLSTKPITLEKPESAEPYFLEDSPEELVKALEHLMVTIVLQELLFDSLLAEQSARFLAMDTSTRNAETLVNQMKLEYNKVRQALITRELTELAASYS